MSLAPLVFIEDHICVSDAIGSALEANLPLKHVKTFATFESAVEGVATHQPKIVIVKSQLSGGFGPKVIDLARGQGLADCKWILLSDNLSAFSMRLAIRCGVFSAVSKSNSLETVITCVRSTLAGKPFFCSESSLAMQQIIMAQATIEKFNDKELKLIHLISEGMTVQKACGLCGITTRTGLNYMTSIRAKTGHSDLAELRKWAVDHGVVCGSSVAVKHE